MSIDVEKTVFKKLDKFVKANQLSLAALVWGLRQESPDSQDTIGIDLYPHCHFVRCSRTAIEKLNEQVEGKIQEILGILDGHNPEEEVVMIGIGKAQVKLIYFKPNPNPRLCFQNLQTDLEILISELESQMN